MIEIFRRKRTVELLERDGLYWVVLDGFCVHSSKTKDKEKAYKNYLEVIEFLNNKVKKDSNVLLKVKV